ncbi:MAG TPA: histidine kinase N-terminal 7TM domain-containing protein, partial [Vicinamibacterales bacterium]|nr:histidine kinase N-terminal 7TM domain-containing protein [Vicinamibacterales bacterium]
MRQRVFGERGLLREAPPRVRAQLTSTTTEYVLTIGSRGRTLVRLTAQLAVVVLLLCLAAANIYVRATWSEREDGVLWRTTPDGVVAREVAPDSPAARAGIHAGDILAEIDRQAIDTEADVVARLHRAANGDALTYTLIRTATRDQLRVPLAPIPSGARALYFMLAPVGIFALLVGAGVRFRRPDNQATLHFFWLTVAFFGMLAFSFSGRLDTLDWVVYWADVVSTLLLPPLIVHFALVFPERPDSWAHSDAGRTALPLLYLPALLLFAARVAALMRAHPQGVVFSNVVTLVERGELVCLAVGLIVGLGIMIRALGRARSVTARRQLRWIVGGTAFGAVPFVFGYAIPFALGFTPFRGADVTAVLLGVVPLAFASAIVRYRLMDVEVIIKRTLVYAAAIAAIAAIYAILLKLATASLGGSDKPNFIIALLATLVVVLLSRPVKNAIQTGLDRVYYRDRYDYRRALVTFARDL